jgi:uncharacterized protein (TIGR02588 family)
VSTKTTRKDRPTGRKFAEHVTLGVSVLVVISIAGFLVRGALQDRPPVVPVDVRVLTSDARQAGGRYVVPVEVRNQGRRTIKDLKVRVAHAAQDGTRETGDVTLDFVPASAVQKVYLYFDRPPRDLRVEAAPFSYQLE